jgi:hypothetical protein
VHCGQDSGDTFQTGEARNVDKDSVVAMEFKKNFKSSIKGNIPSKDITNLFIWSSFQYFLRQPTDSYILFSPVKYFKNLELVTKTFKAGYAFNRKHFHATQSTISCIWWQNKNKKQDTFTLKAFDIENKALVPLQDVVIKKCYTSPQVLFDKREFKDDTLDGVYCGMNGYEAKKLSSTATDRVYNKNILAYLYIVGLNFGQAKVDLTIATLNLRKNGFYLRNDNYLEKLPLFCAKCFCQEKWYEKDVFCTTADKEDAYMKDKDLLQRCFIWACLSQRNHCLSFNGSDGRLYRNELCFDKKTIASKELEKYALNPDEKQLLDIWNSLLGKAKKKKEYNPHYTYGLYQIEKEINLQNEDKEYLYPDIHNDVQGLKVLLKAYYTKYIVKKLFEHELLK